MPPLMKLSVNGICKTFQHTHRDATPALDQVTFQIASGEFVCLLGPSGCGKTTLLNIIAGLEDPDAGEVRVDEKPILGPGRDRVVIFQEAALFPWLNVFDNVAFGLSGMSLSKAEIADRVAHFLKMVGLFRFQTAYAHELSGGMKQRVALARALAIEPAILLMDEPFAALDAQTRDMLHGELQAIWMETGKTIIFVTHNVREALVLGDRVLLFSARPGRLKQDFHCNLPRPRYIEDHSLVDAVQEVLADLKVEVLAAKQKENGNARLAA
jgi:NitT/TauT family transport system ATP-binding protein